MCIMTFIYASPHPQHCHPALQAFERISSGTGSLGRLLRSVPSLFIGGLRMLGWKRKGGQGVHLTFWYQHQVLEQNVLFDRNQNSTPKSVQSQKSQA